MWPHVITVPEGPNQPRYKIAFFLFKLESFKITVAVDSVRLESKSFLFVLIFFDNFYACLLILLLDVRKELKAQV